MNPVALVLEQAKVSPVNPALASLNAVLTYGMLANGILSAAARIEAEGLEKGDLVALHFSNPFYHLTVALALVLRGVASASIQTGFSAAEAKVEFSALLTDRPVSALPGARRIEVDRSWVGVAGSAPSVVEPVELADDDLVLVVLSSGTTGKPKPVAVTAGCLKRRLNSVHDLLAESQGPSRFLTMLGFSSGSAQSYLGVLVRGGVVCFAQNSELALRTIAMFQVTDLFVSTVQLQGLLNAQAKSGGQHPSLCSVLTGGSRVPLTLLREARARLCANTVVAYGSTEGGLISMSRAADEEEGAVGPPAPGVRLQIVDEQGNVLPSGQQGEIRVRTDVMAGYLAGSTDEQFREGWFYPGDLGLLREDGVLVITGRTAELINPGGPKIAPELLEQVLLSRPDVTDAAVFGVPTANGLDQIWAAVVPGQAFNQDEVLRFCRRQLAEKAPKFIITVPEIPRTEMGKIMRHRLRDDVLAKRQAS